ncbi:hypothetical protein [Butyrivibrio sp. LB2008]|uniref:hypothetical protein n=1 Tax=Butyrivibrio sp. LB2008 TaxID=1408305 RepID=UPI000478FA14|nr:hypothetical protein [Butyrivibrio sp. LB2008]
MKIAAIILALVGLLTSFAAVGIIPSIAGFVLSLKWFLQKKSINSTRALAISSVGVLLPVIMYINSFGFSFPYEKRAGLSFLPQIIYDNYTNLGLNMEWMVKNEAQVQELEEVKGAGQEDIDENGINGEVRADNGSMNGAEVNGKNGAVKNAIKGAEKIDIDDEGRNGINRTDKNDTDIANTMDGNKTDKKSGLDSKYSLDIFEKIEDVVDNYKHKPASSEVGASDDDMEFYGGLPVGTLLIAQYFREDDHNSNPVLVLQNKSGKLCRYECMFIARDEAGTQLAVSEKTVEVVQSDAKFVFEGRFDKKELKGKKPAMYEFSVTKRTPYEKDRLDDVAVYSKIEGNSVFLAAENTCDKNVKVDAFVLFFDGDELVDCIWLIPGSNSNVYVEPKSIGTITGDAYYKFDRIETYYTAYEAVEGKEQSGRNE